MSGTNSVYVYSNDLDVEYLIKLASEASLAVDKGEGAKLELMQQCNKYRQAYIKTSAFDKTKSDYVDFLRKGLDFASSYNPMITQTTGGFTANSRTIHVVNSRGINIEESSERMRMVSRYISADSCMRIIKSLSVRHRVVGVQKGECFRSF